MEQNTITDQYDIVPLLKEEEESQTWLLYEYNSIICLISHSSMSSIKRVFGGQAIAWLDKQISSIHMLRICSITEYYDAITNSCHPCSDYLRNLGFPE